MEPKISSNETNEDVFDLLEKELLDKKFINKPIDRELLSKVDVIGFDIDHTLAIYNHETLIPLIYSSFAKYLVEFKNYPKELLIYSNENEINHLDIDEKQSNLKFNEDFVHKYCNSEVIIDLKNGNAISLNENKRVIKAFHGTNELSEEEIVSIYGEEKEFSEFEYEGRSENYAQVIGNFFSHQIPLYLICVHFYDLGELKHIPNLNYKMIHDDISEALKFNYDLIDSDGVTIKKMNESGYFYPEFSRNPKKYLYDYSAKEMLKHLKSKGVGLFFASNANLEYALLIVKICLGEEFLDYFDLGLYYCKKPSFFYPDSNAEAYFPDLNLSDNKIKPGIKSGDVKIPEVYNQLLENKVLVEGNYKTVEEYFKILRKKDNLKFIYVGDSFYADCLHSSKLENWESVAITDHISTGYMGTTPTDFKKVWEFENFFGIKENIFFTKLLRESTLFSLSNVDTFKHLK